MNWHIISIGVIAIIACALPTPSLCEDIPNISVTLDPLCGTGGFNLLGPMAVIVHISNKGNDKIALLADFADGSGIDAKIAGVECEPIGNAALHRVVANHLVAIKAGSEFNFPIYLTNVYKFSSPGIAQVSWKAQVHMIVKDAAETVNSSGNFAVKIRAGDKDELGKELSRLLDFSIYANDPITKMVNVEGICSVRDPLVLPFLQRLLNVPGGESRSLEALIEIWNNDPNAEKIVDNFIETTTNADQVRMIIALYREKHRLLTESQLSRFLTSKDDAIRFCGIFYIHGILESLRITESIPQLSKDSNRGIIDQCDEILTIFSDILSRNESKSFKKQEEAKARANGF